MKQYLCNKAKKCDSYWCIHNQPHTSRFDGEEDSHCMPLECTEKRLSNRECYEEVKCNKIKSPKTKRLPISHEYSFCAYYDEYTRECCNGVDEGTPCLGLFKQKCEVYEPCSFGLDFLGFIELI